MENPLTISLVVTGIGMLMLFLALALLYGLMVLMTRIPNIRELIKERPEAKSGEQRSTGAREHRLMKQRAAVIGVALARAEQELIEVGAPGAKEATSSWLVSPWRALHQQHQLTFNLRKRRTR